MIIVFVSWVTSSCSECENCEVLHREPTITLELINQSALVSSNNSIAQISIEITKLEAELAKINQDLITNQDLANALESKVVAGDSSLVNELNLQRSIVANLVSQRTMINANLTSQRAQLSTLQTFVAQFNNRLTRIDTLYNLENGRYITFADSSQSFSIPLSTAMPLTNVRIVMGSQRFDLRMSYELEVYQDEKSFVGYWAKNVVVPVHSFDSVSVDCRGNCRSENGKVVAYY